MKALVIFIVMAISSTAFSANWNNIDGIYSVTSDNYMDPSENEPKNTHYRIQLKGKSAKDLYTAISVKPVRDECTGAQSKNIGEMQCLFFKESATHECHFSINIPKQKIEYGVAC